MYGKIPEPEQFSGLTREDLVNGIISALREESFVSLSKLFFAKWRRLSEQNILVQEKENKELEDFLGGYAGKYNALVAEIKSAPDAGRKLEAAENLEKLVKRKKSLLARTVDRRAEREAEKAMALADRYREMGL